MDFILGYIISLYIILIKIKIIACIDKEKQISNLYLMGYIISLDIYECNKKVSLC